MGPGNIGGISTFNPVNAGVQAYDETFAGDCSATSLTITRSGQFYLQVTGNAGTAIGDIIGLHFTTESEL
jgi:hypothetical protein